MTIARKVQPWSYEDPKKKKEPATPAKPSAYTSYNVRQWVSAGQRDLAKAARAFEALRATIKTSELRSLAWCLATERRYLEPGLALRASEELAKKLDEPPKLSQLEAVAACYARAGDFNRALEWQKKAVALAVSKRGNIQTAMIRLTLYRRSKPWPPK